jgi:hypothetical protein
MPGQLLSTDPKAGRLLSTDPRAGAAPSSDEPAFRAWYTAAAKQYGLNPDPDSPEQKYDYRAAFKAGAKPDASGHWPSQFKQAGHPNEVVGGFNTRTGERVPGTTQASEAELIRLGWDPATAKRLSEDPLARQFKNQQQMAVGALKGVGNTIFGVAKAVRDYTPVGRISDAILPGAFEQKPPDLETTNTPQRVGHLAEQVGEFFIPASAPGRLGKLGLAAKDAFLTYAQTGSPVQAGVSGTLSAVLPGASAVSRASAGLESSARKTMVQALGATKEWAKDEAARLAPEMLRRGVGGSRAALLETAKATAARVGAELSAAYQAAAAAGETVPAHVIQGHLQVTADALKVPDAAGVLQVIPGTEGVIAKLDELGAFVASLGGDIPVDKAAKIKGVWDGLVAKAGLYGPKATASATDHAAAYGIREAANSFRELLNTNPTIEALNKEASFWIGLRKVLKETQKRTEAQGGGLIAAGMGGSGAIVGALSGDSASDRATKAILGGIAGRQFVKLVQSPAWRTQVTGPMKQYLADALASGSAGRVTGAMQRLLASLPAQVRTSVTAQ